MEEFIDQDSVALLKSRKQALRSIPGLSREDNQLCIMSNRQKVVEVPLRQPDWLGSMMCSKSSRTLETIAVREIGLKSPHTGHGRNLRYSCDIRVFPCSGEGT